MNLTFFEKKHRKYFRILKEYIIFAQKIVNKRQLRLRLSTQCRDRVTCLRQIADIIPPS